MRTVEYELLLIVLSVKCQSLTNGDSIGLIDYRGLASRCVV